ncbi:probable steroid-binding protein 3 [Phalaenopsis equestris]|uniref:probable steroid-binding protein 3 n=1 Tax=Phalaenopsis equestris TaxID=78828 RepID=UPI0009E4BBD4|nr:probable steroid-binding protein 3 [Phalaenopsis equestris]
MDLTSDQLKDYDGSDESKPIYISIRGVVFDVSTGKSFYGPGGTYAIFAGREASRALAKMSKNEEDVSGNLDGLSVKEMGVLEDWEKKFQAKYPVVGRLIVS